MEIKKFHSNINDNLDDVNLKIYEDDNEENSKDNQNKDSIEIIRRQEYLLQMKTEVKFPIYKILQKFNYIQDNEEYKLCSKIRIDSYKNNFIDSINDTNNILNINDNNNQILDISNEIFEENLLTVKNNKQNNNFDESEECLTGYLFIFQETSTAKTLLYHLAYRCHLLYCLGMSIRVSKKSLAEFVDFQNAGYLILLLLDAYNFNYLL